MFPCLEIEEGEAKGLSEKVFSPMTPFYDKLITGITRNLVINQTNNLLEADFIEGGRGLDIKGLLRVYIILPMYIGLKDRGLNIRTIR